MITGRLRCLGGGGSPDRVVRTARVAVYRVPRGSAHDKQDLEALKAAATAVTRGQAKARWPWPVR
jgi:hypothetical protein